MGRDLYGVVMQEPGYHHACRVYAPVGSHEDLLPYLVRRLLENGSNTSFVNRIVDERLPVEKVAEDPLARVAATRPVAHPAIPLPRHLFGEERLNSFGVNLANESEVLDLAARMAPFTRSHWNVEPILAVACDADGEQTPNVNPASLADRVGKVRETPVEVLDRVLQAAWDYRSAWDAVAGSERAACLEKAAGLMEENFAELMALIVREAGKTAHDAIAEILELPLGTVKTHLHRARKQMAEALGAGDAAPDMAVEFGLNLVCYSVCNRHKKAPHLAVRGFAVNSGGC